MTADEEKFQRAVREAGNILPDLIAAVEALKIAEELLYRNGIERPEIIAALARFK